VKLERTFAHCYETGAMRRLHLRGRENVAKRVLIHAAGFNVGLMMRLHYGLRKPRSLSNAAAAAAAAAARALVFGLVEKLRRIRAILAGIGAALSVMSARRVLDHRVRPLYAAE
jgi:transposase